MSELTREAFRLLLEQAIQHSLDLAQQQVSDPLPKATRLELALDGASDRILSLDEVVSLLYRDGAFPRIIDVFVLGIAQEQTLMYLRPSGHPLTTDLAQTWNQPAGMGPFKSLGLLLPGYLAQHTGPLSRQDLEKAAAYREKFKQLSR